MVTAADFKKFADGLLKQVNNKAWKVERPRVRIEGPNEKSDRWVIAFIIFFISYV